MEGQTSGVDPGVLGGPVAERPNGPVAAVVLATGVGAFALGFLTVLAEASLSAHDWLQFNDRVGPLSGKVVLATLAFWGTWAILALLLRRRDVNMRVVTTIMVVLVALGLLGTFPPFFQEFTVE